MYLGHRAEVCTLIAQAKLKSRTAKKSVKLIVSVLRCSHSFPLAPRLAHSSVTTEWPFQLVPGDLLLLVGPCLFLRPSRPSHRRAAAWPVRVTDDCDTKPAKVLNCLYSAARRRRLQPLTSGYPSILPPETPASLASLPAAAAGRGASPKVQSCNKF